MSAEPVKVTDARLSECLAAGGGVCPFCGSADGEYLGQDFDANPQMYIDRMACRKCGMEWNELFDLSAISVSCEHAAEGSDGHSKTPQDKIISDLRAAAGKLADEADHILDVMSENATTALAAPYYGVSVRVHMGIKAVRELLPKGV